MGPKMINLMMFALSTSAWAYSMFPEDLPQLCNHERFELNVTIKRILVLMTDGVQFTMDQMIKMTLWLVNCIICTCVFSVHTLPVGSCTQQAGRRRGSRPSHPPELQTASPRSYEAELGWRLAETKKKVVNVPQAWKCKRQNAAGHAPCSLMVAMVTLAADREWTFLCRKQEVRKVVAGVRMKMMDFHILVCFDLPVCAVGHNLIYTSWPVTGV